MHEMGIMYQVLDVALRVGEEQSCTKVTKINLDIGVMSGIMGQYVQMYFSFMAKDTICEDAQININWLPADFVCADCGHITQIHEPETQLFCENCGSGSVRLISGREFRMASIAVV